MPETSENLNALVKQFHFTKVLNSNPQNKIITLLGTIQGKDAIINLEKPHFQAPTSDEEVSSLASSLVEMFHNDVYFTGLTDCEVSAKELKQIKVNLIYPATQTHIQKYLEQKYHMVRETPIMYKDIVKPYINKMYESGRLQWVENILYNGAESERVVYQDDDMVILPDMKWDGKNMDSFYLVSILKRKDIRSLRDLNYSHVDFLTNLSEMIKKFIPQKYNNRIQSDQLRIFIHYQPSYYHFHIHIVNILHTGLGNGIAVGKAWLLDDIIDQLEHFPEGHSFEERTLTYVIGENHEVWKRFQSSS